MDPASGDFDSACKGLADGWARRLGNHAPVFAGACRREDGPFYCAACHAEVVLRQGVERTRHFAHLVGTLATGPEEGALHRACKQEMLAGLRAANPDGHWEAERSIPARPERGIAQLRPDLSGRVRGLPVAIEIQASALGIESILQRTRAYAQRGISVLWLVPVPEQLPDDGMRPRSFERYFHTLYLGRTYYWWPGMGVSVLPVHYASATYRVAPAEWYRPGAERVQIGGYEATYRTIKTPWCGPRLDISADFAARRREGFVPENTRKAVPACTLWMDRLERWW